MPEINFFLFIPFTDAPMIERSLVYVRNAIDTISEFGAKFGACELRQIAESDIECLRYLESILLRCMPE